MNFLHFALNTFPENYFITLVIPQYLVLLPFVYFLICILSHCLGPVLSKRRLKPKFLLPALGSIQGPLNSKSGQEKGILYLTELPYKFQSQQNI